MYCQARSQSPATPCWVAPFVHHSWSVLDGISGISENLQNSTNAKDTAFRATRPSRAPARSTDRQALTAFVSVGRDNQLTAVWCAVWSQASELLFLLGVVLLLQVEDCGLDLLRILGAQVESTV